MTARTGTYLKNNWAERDPYDYNVDLIDSIAISGDADVFAFGAFTNDATDGTAITISETVTAAVRSYADDGNVAIGTATGSVPDVRNLLVRTLLTVDNSAFDMRVHSIMGQLKSIDAEWGDEQVSAVHGYLELTRTAGTITLQSYGVTAGLMATVETAGDFGVAATHNLAGVAAISKLGYTGTFTDNTNTSGVYVGIYDSTHWSDSPTLDKWNHGLYIQAAAVDKGIQIGELSSVSQVGLTFVATTGLEGISVYCDDGNVALTGGTPFAGIHSRNMFFKDQANGTTVIGAWGQLKYASGVDIGPARVAAVEGYNELMTTNIVKSGGYLVGVSSQMEATAGTFTVNNGGVCAGFHARLTGAGTAVQDAGGILAGLKIDENITTGNWGYGVYMPGTDVAKGLFIVGGTSPDTDTDGIAIHIGTFAAPLSLNTASMKGIAAYFASTSTTGGLTGMRLRTRGNAASGTLSVTSALVQADVLASRVVQDVVAISAEGIAKDSGTINSWFIGVSAKIEDELASGGTGSAPTLSGRAAVMRVMGLISAAPTDGYYAMWFDCQQSGTTPQAWDALIGIENGGQNGSITNFMLDAGVPGFATIGAGAYSSADGYITVNFGGQAYRMPLYIGVD